MTTFSTAEAERALRRAIDALRSAGLKAEANRLAALQPVTDRETARAAADAALAAAYAVAHVAWAASWPAANEAARDATYAADEAAWAVVEAADLARVAAEAAEEGRAVLYGGIDRPADDPGQLAAIADWFDQTYDVGRTIQGDLRRIASRLAEAEAEAARLREQLEAADARLAAAEEEIGRLREAIGDHGRCWGHHYPGYPRGDRHAPGCDYDPDLRAALEGQRIEGGDR